MGLFREAGRRIEQFKQAAEAAAEEEADYRCEACGETVFTDGDPGHCPECGEDALVATEDTETETTETEDTETETTETEDTETA